jgi:Flp pilus assembly protein TadD
MTEAATGEVKWTASYSVNPADADLQMQQSRLAAGVGHALALRINELLNADTPSSTKSKVVIEQATAHINQTSPERFQAAQAMLEKALTEDAVPWLQKSIAITSASGRTHMLLAAAYQQLGKTEEAREAMEKARELRPGSTVGNVPPPRKNSSPVYIEASDRIMRSMAAAGLPEG